jgi:hypothetical protein
VLRITPDPARHGRSWNLATLCRAAATVLLGIRLSTTQAIAETNGRSFPGLPDPGTPTSLSIRAASAESRSSAPATRPAPPAILHGPDARLQPVVTATYSTGQLRDWTHAASYTVEPANVVSISPSGEVAPLTDGRATITATGTSGLSASLPILVEHFSSPDPINFPNQVIPIFTKATCNSGGCHGKLAGQNGFRLSLLGFDPPSDYRFLVHEGRGRRLSPAEPERSLLLLKATAQLAHGGGARIKADSSDYRILRRWIAQGMPFGKDSDPTVVSLEVFPASRALPPDGTQQLMAAARYTDGSYQDVTRAAQYDANDKQSAEVDPTGLVKMTGRPGDVAIMVRYQGRVAVFQATVPVGAPVNNLPSPRNFVDDLAFAKLKALGLPPSPVCDDATFIRRVTLDITGQLPTGDDARAFLLDTSSDKRDTLIDRLLASEAYADVFTAKWCAVLRNKRTKPTYERGNYLFQEWMRNNIQSNKPYDQIVRELLTATGEPTQTPAVTWYRQADDMNAQTEDTAQVFLGTRIQCARCHHHPYEKWSQDDYYGLAAFFSRLGKKEGAMPDEFRIFHTRGGAGAANPRTQKGIPPTGLGEARPCELSPDDDPRQALAAWMVGPNGSRMLSRALVNRYWKHFFGRGIVEPEDDMRETNPPSNPALLDALAADFVKSGYDLKALVRTICRSHLYQLEGEPNAYNAADHQAFSRFYTRRLPAEVLLDAMNQVNGSTSTFDGLPAGGRAVQMRDLYPEGMDYFLRVFGRPAGSSACECERSDDVSLAQSIHLVNSTELFDRLQGGRAKNLAISTDSTDADKITALYYDALSRPPTTPELSAAAAYVGNAKPQQRPAAYEDLVWALVNTKEFLFNH